MIFDRSNSLSLKYVGFTWSDYKDIGITMFIITMFLYKKPWDSKERFFTWNKNKGKGNGAGLAWESKSHCFADKFGKPYTHSFGTDTQHDYSQGNRSQL